MPASSTFRPVSAQPTIPGKWKSPMETASASPCARCRTSAAVHTPTPGIRRSRRSASASPRRTVSSSRPATAAADRIARTLPPSTPALCHSHDGIWIQVLGAGITLIPRGITSGPGAGSPNLHSSSRQDREASLPVTFCSKIAGTSDSITSAVVGTRHPRYRLADCRTISWHGTNPAGSSSSPSRAGSDSINQAAPGPQAAAVTAASARLMASRTVPGPSGVRLARQIAPCRSARYAGSPLPWRNDPSVARRSTGRPGRQARVSSGTNTSLHRHYHATP